MTERTGSVIWVVSGHQGPIQAYRERKDADEFAAKFEGGAWVNSLGLIEPAAESRSEMLGRPSISRGRGRYQGSADPGEPTMLMQPQTKPVKANAESGVSEEVVQIAADES